MQRFYALIATGSSYSFADKTGGGFNGGLSSMSVLAENRAQAFLRLFRRINESCDDITILKNDYQEHLLGFTREEWQEISTHCVAAKEGYPDKAGVQIQAISDQPFR